MRKDKNKKEHGGTSRNNDLGNDNDRNARRDSNAVSDSTTVPFKRHASKTKLTSAEGCASSPKHVTHTLPIKGTIYLDYIKRGLKRFEGRVYDPKCSNFRVGDHLKLYDNESKRGIICEILSIDIYPSFEDMLKAKGVLLMLPQLKQEGVQWNEQKLLQMGVQIYQAFPDSDLVRQYGVAAIGVKYLQDV